MRGTAVLVLGLVLGACAALEELQGPPEPRPDACAEEEGSLSAVGRPTKRVEAEYPRGALRTGKGGYVCLNFTVQRDGRVANICVSDEQPERLFDRASVEALEQWEFEPTDTPYRSGTCLQFAVR